MIILRKNNRKVIIVSLVFLFAIFSCNVAKANTLTDSVSGIFSFFNNNIIVQVKNDFCNNYANSIADGEWKAGEFRTNLGKSICNGVSISTNINNTAQSSSSNFTVSKTNSLSYSSINNPAPDVYVTKSSTVGTSLDDTQIFNLTNTERKANDSTLVNLTENNILANIASIRVKDMFAKQYFAHVSPTGDNASLEAGKNGYSYITIGENIALGNFDGSQGLLTAWMNSPGHRANILNKNYTEIGVYAEKGIYQGQSVWIAAQVFGKPLSGCSEPDTALKNEITTDENSANSMSASINNIDAELKTISSTDMQTYNSKVAERNNLSETYNNLISVMKNDVAKYNSEVATFNSCVKTI